MENEMEVGAKQDALNAKTKFVETGDRKIAYRSIGKELPIIIVNRFRGTSDTWDPAFLDALASKFDVKVTTVGNSYEKWQAKGK
jgi:hypothetical protein